jgi:hypothetical protein
MSNPSKAKGTRAETRVVRYLTARGLNAARRALAGSADEGDLCMILNDGTEVTLEVKAGTQTANYSRTNFEKWKRQTIVEGENADCIPALVIVRHHRPLANAEVWMPCMKRDRDILQWIPVPKGIWSMMYLDEFAAWLAKE